MESRRTLHFVCHNVVVSTPREDLLSSSAYWSERNPFSLLFLLLTTVVLGWKEGRPLAKKFKKKHRKKALRILKLKSSHTVKVKVNS